MVAAVRREPARVIGDGVHSIRELVERENRDPRRGDSYEFPLFRLHLGDDERGVLANHGRTVDSIPARGEMIYLRRDPHTYHGGTNADVTDRVHPETARMAIDAALMVGLDVAGIDLIATDISRPLSEQQGVFLEVNAEPAINLHRAPVCDRPRPVIEGILDELFPHGRTGRIPVTGVIGGPNAIELARQLARTRRRGCSLVTADQVLLDGIPLILDAITPGERLDALLSHPRVQSVVAQATLQDVLMEGVPWDRCRRLIIADLNSSFGKGILGCGRMLNRACETVISTCAKRHRVILNVDDPAVEQLAERCPGACLVSNDPQHPLLQRANGCTLVTWLHGRIWWRCGDHTGTCAPFNRSRLDDYEQRRIELLRYAAHARWASNELDLPPRRRPQPSAA